MAAATIWAEAGHQQIWHRVEGNRWRGPKEWAKLSDSPNQALCGKQVSRRMSNQPDETKAICPQCQRAAAPSAGLLDEQFERRTITLGDCFVDPRVQRNPQLNWQKQMSVSFDSAQFALMEPIVADRATCEGGLGPNGERYAILDAQHKIHAARLAGYPPDTPMNAKVFQHLPLTEQAKNFRDINNARHSVKKLSDFKVAVTQQVPDAVAIYAALESYALRPGSSGVDGNVACIDRLYRAYHANVLDDVLATLTAVWGNRHEAFHAHVLDAFIVMYVAGANREHFVRRLKVVRDASPENIIGAARNVTQGTGKNAALRGANFLAAKVYNTNLRGNRQPIRLFS